LIDQWEFRLISWKHSFQKLSEEYEMAKKKKQALDNLLSSGRISQSTFEVFNDEIHDGMLDIERQQHLLQEKMNAKVAEITEQIRSLEMLLANFEIQHVAGEIDEEAYRRQIDLLTIGLDSFRIELDAIKEAANQNKRKWSYISAILERWAAEGRSDGTYRRDTKKTDPDKYIKGKYGHMVQR